MFTKRNLVLVLALVLVIPIIASGVNRISSFRGTSQQVSDAEAQLQQLKKENADLKNELLYKSSDSFAEQEIRDKLGMVKPGETEVIIPRDAQQNNDQAAVKDTTPNWQKWRDLFLGKS